MEYNLNRYKNIEKLDYKLEVVTPLFLGGADPKKSEIRSPSLKGILRFWWRAIYGPLIIDHMNNNTEKGIIELKKLETDIFGSQESKSKVSISFNTNDGKPTCERLPKGTEYTVNISNKNKNLGIIDYLAYGLHEYDRSIKDFKYIHSYYKTRTNLNLKLCLLGLKENQKNQVLLALKSLISFGGLGAKSRNGFGSLYVNDLYINLSDLPCIKNEILLPYTAFSNKAKLLIFPKQDSWSTALSDIGLAYRENRLTLENKNNYTRRGYIGRPIVQSKSNNNEEIKTGRHSKPFFLHVNKIGQYYQGQILFLPYHYYKPSDHQDYMRTCEELIDKIAKTKGVIVK